MNRTLLPGILAAWLLALATTGLPAEHNGVPAGGAAVGLAKLVEKAPGVNADVNCSPRPFRDTTDVPLRTSIYFEVEPAEQKVAETFQKSLAVSLQADRGTMVELLRPGEQFAHGASGWLRPSGESILVYIEPGGRLKPETHYAVHVSAQPAGAHRRAEVGSWSFTTEAGGFVHALNYQVDLQSPPVEWRGRFFDGVCNVIFCTRATNYGPTWELMAQAHREHPRGWSLQRDFWLTGMEFRGPEGFFPSNLPNIVRERETRRVAAMEPVSGGVALRLEDFFGHEQYGIPTARPVGQDYHPGEEVLVADGYHSARAKVLAADSTARTVTLGPIETPADGWKIAYSRPLPTKEDPDAPGLFPPGGCYLRKYDPPGTACYYWGRVDKEWDLAHRQGRRVVPNFADAPGDLSRDGQSWTTVKDYGQWHEVARTITGHIIDRYGREALNFTWSIFNEPDLLGVFWRGTWDDLQRYYDYTSDGILRAFEDRGYESKQVFIGGLEQGGIFGTNFVNMREFLAHCSPQANARGALPQNAAVADQRLEGKRSRRVEELCREHTGKGAPCDFISVHIYNRSEMSAAKLIRAKEIALEVDPDFYKGLWVNSHEACPDWMPPGDEAAGDVYLGDGYFASWCADVVHRLLLRAAADPRFAYGETILTVWPPPDNFAALNAVTRVIHYHETGEGTERTATVPMPIFHALSLLSDFGPRFWVLPEQRVGGHIAGGFASRDEEGTVRLLLFTHGAHDTQSRSEASFEVTLDLSGLAKHDRHRLRVREFRFDKDHNSYLHRARKLRERAAAMPKADAGAPGQSLAPACYSRAELEQVQNLAQCRPTRTATAEINSAGGLRWTCRLAANGLSVIVMEPP